MQAKPIEVVLKDVEYKYRNKAHLVLDGITISFRSGETTIIFGPNGAGKTTLMKIAALIYKPSRGEVLVNNSNFWSLPENKKIEIRREITFVHEKPIIVRGTVLENLLLGLSIRGKNGKEVYERTIKLMEELKIEDILEKDARKLSSGQMQLVSIVRAISIEPSLLFLDEPFSHLDKERRAILERILREELRETGIVMTSHDEGIISRFQNSRVIYMENGKAILLDRAHSFGPSS